MSICYSKSLIIIVTNLPFVNYYIVSQINYFKLNAYYAH